MLRKAIKEDVPTLVDWMKKLVRHVQNSSADPYVSNLEEDFGGQLPSWFNEAIDDQYIDPVKSIIYIAEDMDTPVGFIYARIIGPFMKSSKIKTIGQIELCWVEPLYRRKGIGANLVRQAENWFKTRNIEYVDLQYLQGNVEAELSWKQLGYLPYRVAARKKL